MTPQIKQRIEQIRHGEVPEGYKKTKFGIVPEEWENKKLGKLFAERNDVNCSDEQLLSITADRGVIPRAQIQGKDNSSEDKSKYKHISKGDIGYNTMRMWQGVSALSLYDGIVSPAYTVLKPSAQVNALCFSYFFKLTNMINVFYRHSQGLVDDTRSLKYEWFKSIAVSVPSLAEQEKIAEILRTQDKVIALQQKKIDELKRLKKVYLSKMFPKKDCNVPEIRFPGFTDPWEQRKLGEIATFINGRAYSQPELLSEGKYKVLRVGNFYTNDSWYYSDLELSEKYYANYGDLLYTWSATFGPHIWLGDKVIYHYHIWKVELSEYLEKHFAVQLLEQDIANILSSKNGSTMVHITKKGMEDKDVIIPSSTSEQKLIGEFFGHLDNLITLHQRKLEEEQKKKKALMLLLLTGIVRV